MTDKTLRNFAEEVMNRAVEEREEMLIDWLSYISTQEIGRGTQKYAVTKIRERVVSRQFKTVSTSFIIFAELEEEGAEIIGVMDVISTANNLNKDRITFSSPRNITFREVEEKDVNALMVVVEFEDKFRQFNHLLKMMLKITNARTKRSMYF